MSPIPLDYQIGCWSIDNNIGTFVVETTSNLGYWKEPLAGQLVTTQPLNTITIGMDWPYTFQGPVDPTGWTVVFTLYPKDADVITLDATTSSVNNSVSIILPNSQTSLLSAAPNGIPWRLVRTDTGNIAPLAEGFVIVINPTGGGILPP